MDDQRPTDSPRFVRGDPDQEEEKTDTDSLEYLDPDGLEEHDSDHNSAPSSPALSQPERPPALSGTNEEVDDPLATTSRIETIKVTQAFIKEIQAASLDNGNLDDDVLERLRNPPKEPFDISDPDTRLSIDLYLAVTNASEDTYQTCREAFQRRHPGSKVLSYYSVKKLVAEITGVVAAYDDMCINSCHAFTGPFSHLESRSICGEA